MADGIFPDNRVVHYPQAREVYDVAVFWLRYQLRGNPNIFKGTLGVGNPHGSHQVLSVILISWAVNIRRCSEL